MVTHLTDWVTYNADRYGSEVAVESLDTGRQVTWIELEDRIARLSSVLVDLGIRHGDRVGLIADDDWRVLALQFACIRTGAIFVPFNWRLTVNEIEVLCNDAELGLLIHDATWQDTATKLGEHLGVQLAGWSCADVRNDIDALMDLATPIRSTGHYAGDQIAQILYTSGTTGLPKGALITLGGLAWHAMNVQHEMRIGSPPARYLSALPLFHAAGLNAIVNPTLMAGGRIGILRRFDPARTAELLGDKRHGFTHFNAAPVMYRMVMENVSGPADFSHIHAGMVGGGAIPTDVGSYFSERGLELQAGWGATEMGPSVTLMPKASRVAKAHTVGFPVQHVQIRIVDPATNEEVASGEVGEAWVRGPSISPGYWRRDPETDEDSVAGWFKCGDAVSIDEEGFVVLRGRFKDMYKSGGENVFCAEVERVIASHRDVQDAAVVGMPHEKWGEVGYAVVVPETGRTVDESDLIAHVASRLAKYKVPTKVVVVEDFPRNVTGKIQKNVLRDQLS
ncbi:class I adenylate-forming enzyme family protein [Streptomyces brasiliensis]|uniref:Acid--CoA ligase n=1 Tax=Streptomyces brasiliensis TaxID=1954 RepID=A0A917L5S5_9ACTN|nr:AMP-binding protein [Streptomyces brasiliensis]GGJ41001.1 acid--CoA ligase [Streptomyces brasiliensis]